MTCTSCGKACREGARVCSGCGPSLVSRCPACGAESEAGAGFCDACGAPLAAASPAPDAGARKVVNSGRDEINRETGMPIAVGSSAPRSGLLHHPDTGRFETIVSEPMCDSLTLVTDDCPD